MSGIGVSSAEAQRFGEQEDPIVEKLKDFLTSSLRWSFAPFGPKDFLMNKQVTFMAFSIALIAIFGINSRTTRSNHGMTFISFMFLMIGCLIVGIAINLIVLNSCIKWVIFGLFIAMVVINPDTNKLFKEMQQILKSMFGAACARLGNSFSQVQVAIQNRLKNVKDREESSMNNNPVTQPVGGDGGVVGEDNV